MWNWYISGHNKPNFVMAHGDQELNPVKELVLSPPRNEQNFGTNPCITKAVAVASQSQSRLAMDSPEIVKDDN